MDPLRAHVIRLAHANPALRPHLLPLLKTATSPDLQRELDAKVQRMIRDYDEALATGADFRAMTGIGGPFGKWFTDTFAVETSRTPRGAKALKDKALKFLWTAKNGPSQRGETRSLKSEWEGFKQDVPELIAKFSQEGGGVTLEVKTPVATYKNMAGLDDANLKKYVASLDNLFKSVQGWRRKALSGDFTVALAGPDKFRGTSGGKYNQPSDTLFVRATPNVMRRGTGNYGSLDYILIHELGHRYEAKSGIPNERDIPRTTKYSYTESMSGSSEAFAEAFALGHFGIRSVHGDEFGDKLDKFEALMKGRPQQEAPARAELPPHLKKLIEGR